MKLNLLITGASGFVGSNLIETLKNDFNLIEINRNRRNSHAKQIIWDYTSDLNDIEINEDIHAIIHLSSIVGINTEETIIDYFDINTRSTLQLLELGQKIGIKFFLYFSTGGVYGYKDYKITERSAPKPIDFYSITKYLSEIICNTYKRRFFVQIFRLFFPYGKGQRNKLIPSLMSKLINEQVIRLNSTNGKPIINPVYIDDVCEVVKKSIMINDSFTVNIAGPEIVSIQELSEFIAKELHRTPKFEIVKDNRVKNLIGDTTFLQSKVQYEPKIGIIEGIRRIIN
jgi:UDP-glucose 4-epimerase